MERQSKTLFGAGGLRAVANNFWRQLTQPPIVQEKMISEAAMVEQPTAIPMRASHGTRAIQLPVDSGDGRLPRRHRPAIE